MLLLAASRLTLGTGEPRAAETQPEPGFATICHPASPAQWGPNAACLGGDPGHRFPQLGDVSFIQNSSKPAISLFPKGSV